MGDVRSEILTPAFGRLRMTCVVGRDSHAKSYDLAQNDVEG